MKVHKSLTPSRRCLWHHGAMGRCGQRGHRCPECRVCLPYPETCQCGDFLCWTMISYDFHEKVGTLEMSCLPSLVAKSAALATDVVAVRAPGSMLRCCKCSWRWRMVSRTAHVPDKVQSRRQLRSPQKRWMVKFNKPQSIGSKILWQLLPPAMMSWVSFLFPRICKIDCSVLVPLTFCVHTPSKHSA